MILDPEKPKSNKLLRNATDCCVTFHLSQAIIESKARAKEGRRGGDYIGQQVEEEESGNA